MHGPTGQIACSIDSSRLASVPPLRIRATSAILMRIAVVRVEQIFNKRQECADTTFDWTRVEDVALSVAVATISAISYFIFICKQLKREVFLQVSLKKASA